MLHCFKLKSFTTKSEKIIFKHLMYMKTCKTNFAQEFPFNQIILENLRKSALLSPFLNLRKVSWNLHLLGLHILVWNFLTPQLSISNYLYLISYSLKKKWKVSAKKLRKKGFSDLVSLILIHILYFLHVLDTITVTNKLYCC